MRRFCAALITALALVLVPLGSAHAAVYVDADKRGDVHVYTFSEDDPFTEPELVPAPSMANGDVVRTRVIHSQRAVAIRVKYRDLALSGEFRADFAQVLTNAGVRRDVTIFAGRGMWVGQSELTRRDGKVIECGLTHRIDYTRNVIRVRIPKSCLHNPRWVRVGLGSFWFRGESTYADDAFLDGAIRERGPVFSPRIRRG